MLQVDPNTGVTMYESDEIIKYLADKYGEDSTFSPPCSVRYSSYQLH
jgi:glutathione S-transferase